MSKERYKKIQEEIEGYGFTILAKDFERPWGAFLFIKEEETQDLILLLQMVEIRVMTLFQRGLYVKKLVLPLSMDLEKRYNLVVGY